jgi:hypothetical protein
MAGPRKIRRPRGRDARGKSCGGWIDTTEKNLNIAAKLGIRRTARHICLGFERHCNARNFQASKVLPYCSRYSLHGWDLYRLDCQACHGASGAGTPPEINSVINPVRATSVAVIMERTKKTGQEMTRTDPAPLAKQASALLLDRFHKGGQNMPPFP